MSQVFIGRQPIFDRNENVYAYELLWRNSQLNEADFVDGDYATTVVVLNALTEFGLDKLVGEHLAFINLTRGFIIGDPPLPEMSGRVVLEVLEDIEVDAKLVIGVKRLIQRGYQIALDDFIYHPKLRPIVEIASIIKLDLLAESAQSLEAHVEKLRAYPVKLLAEKVETQQQYEHCRALGFDYFQGYFFARPDVVQSTRPPANKLALIQLMAKLTEPDIANHELESLIIQDVTLSYRLLRYINSARYGLKKEIDSVSQAMALLGQNTLIHLVNLMSLAQFDDKPQELLLTAIIRGRMTELLANKSACNIGNSGFTAGMFSVLDALLDRPLADLLEEMPLSEMLKQALLNHKGEIGQLLKCVIAYDEADWENCHHPVFSVETLREAYFEAIDWAEANHALTD